MARHRGHLPRRVPQLMDQPTSQMMYRGGLVSGHGARLGVGRRISRFALQQRSRIDFFRPEDGIRRLMWALLKDTLCSYQTHLDAPTVQGQRVFRDAERWLESDDMSWVFSYQSVCAVLGIDSDYLRNEVHRWRRHHRALR